MEKDKAHFESLLAKYISKNATKEEFDLLFSYIALPEYKERLYAVMREQEKNIQVGADVHQVDWAAMYRQIVASESADARKQGMSRWAIAASVVLFLSLSSYLINNFFLRGRGTPTYNQVVASDDVYFKNDVSPGGHRAILKLGDGKEIILDDTKEGSILRHAGGMVNKLDSGQVQYISDASASKASIVMNTLTTPNGGQYALTLPDGTKVWLNAASSITFPSAFSDTERRVRIIGEAYFEVAKNTSKPFKVETNQADVEVLGTHFNVMAYDDEPRSKVTLLEGAVKVKHAGTEVKLVPGQEASYSAGEDKIKVRAVDTEEAVSWVNNAFHFDSTPLPEVLRQLSRWYDVEIKNSNKGNASFTGIISRKNNVSKILRYLQSTGSVDFQIDNKVIIVK